MHYVIRITHDATLSPPDDLAPDDISFGWVIANARVIQMIYDDTLSHPNNATLSPPDDFIPGGTSSGRFLFPMQYVIRMT